MTTPTPAAAPKGLRISPANAVPKARWIVDSVNRHHRSTIGHYVTYAEAVGAAKDSVEDGEGDAEVYNPEGHCVLVVDEFGAFDPAIADILR